MRKDLQEIIRILKDINCIRSEKVRMKLFDKMIETDTALLKLEIAHEFYEQDNNMLEHFIKDINYKIDLMKLQEQRGK